jgi:hypothetical protein
MSNQNINVMNDYFPLISSGEISADQAVQECLARGWTYALRYFSPQCEDDLPYWKMLESDAWQNYKNRQKTRFVKETSKTVIADCGCAVPKNLVMKASLGSSCPDCYDDMSD